jgi:hypothetical protein
VVMVMAVAAAGSTCSAAGQLPADTSSCSAEPRVLAAAQELSRSSLDKAYTAPMIKHLWPGTGASPGDARKIVKGYEPAMVVKQHHKVAAACYFCKFI